MSDEERSQAVGNAVELINRGEVDQAISVLDTVMIGAPQENVGPLIARGTARAMKRDLQGKVPFSATVWRLFLVFWLAFVLCISFWV